MPLPADRDTAPTALAVQLDAWRAMSPAAKLAQVCALTAMLRVLEWEGLRRRHPALEPAALQRLVLARRVGPDLAARIATATPGA